MAARLVFPGESCPYFQCITLKQECYLILSNENVCVRLCVCGGGGGGEGGGEGAETFVVTIDFFLAHERGQHDSVAGNFPLGR